MSIFKINKYSKWYFDIIEKAKEKVIEEYFEIHHIIPRSCGGTDNLDNLIKLTYREHFLCHWLLTKCMIHGEHKRNMYHALGFICGKTKKTNGRGIIPSWKYELKKKAISLALKNRIVSDETKEKLRQIRYQQINDPEYHEYWKTTLCHDKWDNERKEKHKKTTYFNIYNKTEEHRAKVIKSNQTRKISDISKKKQSDTMKIKAARGEKNAMANPIHVEKVRQSKIGQRKLTKNGIRKMALPNSKKWNNLIEQGYTS